MVRVIFRAFERLKQRSRSYSPSGRSRLKFSFPTASETPGDTQIICKSSLIVTQVRARTCICSCRLHIRELYTRVREGFASRARHCVKRERPQKRPVLHVSSRGHREIRGILSTRESSYAITHVRDRLVTCLLIFAARRRIAAHSHSYYWSYYG